MVEDAVGHQTFGDAFAGVVAHVHVAVDDLLATPQDFGGGHHLRPAGPIPTYAVHATANPLRNGRHRIDVPLDFINLPEAVVLRLIHRAERAPVPMAAARDPEQNA